MKINYEQVADDLDTTCDEIDKRGWHTGGLAEQPPVPIGGPYDQPYENGTPLPDDVAVCVMGGLTLATGYEIQWRGWGWSVPGLNDEATGRNTPRWVRRYQAAEVLRLHVGLDVARWNDFIVKDQQALLDTVRSVAKDCRKTADGIE